MVWTASVGSIYAEQVPISISASAQSVAIAFLAASPAGTFPALSQLSASTGGAMSNAAFSGTSSLFIHNLQGQLILGQVNPPAISRLTTPTCGNNIVEFPEQCDGSSCCTSSCTFVAANTLCRAALSNCDVDEFCTGTSGDCPADTFIGAGFTCRQIAGKCTTCSCLLVNKSQHAVSQVIATNQSSAQAHLDFVLKISSLALPIKIAAFPPGPGMCS